MTRWARKMPCPSKADEGAYYQSLPPLQRPYSMRFMTGKLVSALGEERINQLHGIELLAALEGAPHLVHAQTDLEHLVAGCRQPWCCTTMRCKRGGTGWSPRPTPNMRAPSSPYPIWMRAQRFKMKGPKGCKRRRAPTGPPV